MQDLNDKITGGTLTAAEWNEVPSEIQNVIEGLGISLSSGDLNQLGKAIAGYVANGNFYTGGGVVNAYTLAAIGLKQVSPAYTDGFESQFIVPITSTGPTTYNVAGLGVKDVVLQGDVALSGGELIAGRYATIIYDTALGKGVLQNPFAAADEVAIFAHQEASGVDGGAATSGAFETRTIDTTILNEISGASLAANVVTLPAGTYEVEWENILYSTNGTANRLRNTSDSLSFPGLTVEANSSSGHGIAAPGTAKFTIAGAKDFELQSYPAASHADGYGRSAAGGAGTNTYLLIKITKVA